MKWESNPELGKDRWAGWSHELKKETWTAWLNSSGSPAGLQLFSCGQSMPSHSVFLKLLEAQRTIKCVLLALWIFLKGHFRTLRNCSVSYSHSHNSLRPQPWILKVIYLFSFCSISLCICLGVLQVAGWSSGRERFGWCLLLSHIPGHVGIFRLKKKVQ